jgi:hypothetical protein
LKSSITSASSRGLLALACATAVTTVIALIATALADTSAHASKTCADYDNQRDAQLNKDTRDADGDGIYCEALPCPCLKPGQQKSKPPPTTKPRKPVKPPRPKAVCKRGVVPDHHCTPGVSHPIARKTMCAPEFSFRAEHVPAASKRRVLRAYGVPRSKRKYYEIDLLVPRVLGGSPVRRNLWPQSWTRDTYGFGAKEALELALVRDVCDGVTSLRLARRLLVRNWNKGLPRRRTITENAASAGTTATLSYQRVVSRNGSFSFRGLTLSAKRAGSVVGSYGIRDLNSHLCDDDCHPWPVGYYDAKKSLRVLNLDGDPEPEILVELYSGGANCCSLVLIYDYIASSGSFRASHRDWNGGLGYELRDLDGDGVPEFVSADGQFFYEFDLSRPESRSPIRIARFGPTGLQDVTRAYPTLIQNDAAQQLREYKRYRPREYPSVRGMLAAYAADTAMLGRADEAFVIVQQAVDDGWVSDGYNFTAEEFPQKLREFLVHLGYLPS